MEIITYSLRKNQAKSDGYYDAVAGFTDAVLAEAQDRLSPLVKAFCAHAQAAEGKATRSWPEYVFELLTLGVVWHVYAGRAPGVAQAPRQVLAGLVRLRRQGGWIKSVADWARGVLSALFLLPNVHSPKESALPTLERLDQLLGWLTATDNFKQEVARLRAWQRFWAGLPVEEAIQNLAAVIAFASWFQAQSEAVLGCYTPNVERFLAQTHPGYRWREDYTFCGRQPVEYHLNMVGTEILNRAFRQAFLASALKIVIVPPCMRARPEGECQAQVTPHGARCVGCTPGCRVNQVTRLGEKHGFTVLIMPDELSVFSGGAVKPAVSEQVGVVGVSCVLTNAPGGWETQELGVPAQGVLLDYCGCIWHWHKKGIPTDINVGQLLRVMGISKE